MCSTVPLLISAIIPGSGGPDDFPPPSAAISIRLTDPELRVIRGGALSDDQMSELAYEHADRSMSLAGGIAREMADSWWATAGADLIRANLTP